MAVMPLALNVFLGLLARRDELRRLPPNNPVDKDELEILEELVEALVGSGDEQALEAYIAELSGQPPPRSLQ